MLRQEHPRAPDAAHRAGFRKAVQSRDLVARPPRRELQDGLRTMKLRPRGIAPITVSSLTAAERGDSARASASSAIASCSCRQRRRASRVGPRRWLVVSNSCAPILRSSSSARWSVARGCRGLGRRREAARLHDGDQRMQLPGGYPMKRGARAAGLRRGHRDCIRDALQNARGTLGAQPPGLRWCHPLGGPREKRTLKHALQRGDRLRDCRLAEVRCACRGAHATELCNGAEHRQMAKIRYRDCHAYVISYTPDNFAIGVLRGAGGESSPGPVEGHLRERRSHRHTAGGPDRGRAARRQRRRHGPRGAGPDWPARATYASHLSGRADRRNRSDRQSAALRQLDDPRGRRAVPRWRRPRRCADLVSDAGYFGELLACSRRRMACVRS